MKFKITRATNFCRVFRLPQKFPEGYCFDGGHPAIFQLVDWFNPFDTMEGNKEFDPCDPEYLKHVEDLKKFIKGKCWFNPEFTYMILTDYGDVFLINPEMRSEKLQQEMDGIIHEILVKTGIV